MDVSLIALFCALGGGAFSAAIGGLPSFIFTGFMVFVGIAAQLGGTQYDFVTNVAFGPMFGPHIAFGGAVAAVAYAARTTDVEGRDIAAPLAGYARPDVLAVGAVFGVGAYLVNQFIVGVLNGANWTDTVALTVFLSAVVVRLVFGRTGIFGTPSEEARQTGRMGISADAVWVGHQASAGMCVALGLCSGLIAAFLVITLHQADPALTAAGPIMMFGLSAVTLILLQIGTNSPVTHHMTLPAGVCALHVLMAGSSDALAMILATAVAVAGALVAELAARIFLIHGDTHIDPPAIAIAIMTGIVLLGDAIF